MTPRKKPSLDAPGTSPEILPGLYVIGPVVSRTRRYITTANNPNTEIVTYTITDEHGHRFYVDDFAPSSYHEVSESVMLPVYVKSYKKKNGDASYTLCIQKNYYPITKGGAF